MSAVILPINTAREFKEHRSPWKRHPMLDKKVQVCVPPSFWPFCLWDRDWWLSWLDPHLYQEGLIINIERDETRGGEQYIVLFEDSANGVTKKYHENRLKFKPGE